MASVEPWPKRPASGVPTPIDNSQIDDLMRRFAEQSRAADAKSEPVLALAAVAEESQPRRNTETAFELLDRAAQAFEVLISRYENLEEELHDMRVQASEAASTIDQWKRLSSGLNEQIKTSDQKLAALKARCEAAEARASEAANLLKIAERSAHQVGERALQAEDLSTKLHDRVVTAFGIGSRMHRVLEAIAPKPEE